MPRELGKTELNKIIVFDKISGSTIELYYRSITSTERIQYKSAILNQLTKSNNIEDAIAMQLAWAEKIITGFKKGDFTLDGKIISSDPSDSDYYAGWFSILKEMATDILLLVIDTILGNTSYIVRTDVPFGLN